MSAENWLGLIVGALLVIYLVVALGSPERF